MWDLEDLRGAACLNDSLENGTESFTPFLTTDSALATTTVGVDRDDMFRKTNVSDTVAMETYSRHGNSYRRMEELLYSRVITAACFVGLVGNLINLCLVVPRGLRHSCGRIEKFAYMGLIALALSDFLFCLSVVPYIFVDQKTFFFTRPTLDLVYTAYINPVINTFTLTSTWLTVTLACGRYLAVCHPMRARVIIGLTFAKRTIVILFLLCALFNLPRYCINSIEVAQCSDGARYYFRFYGYLKLHHKLYMSYMWVYFFVMTVIPVTMLVYCNFQLIFSMRASKAAHNQLRASVKATPGTNRKLTLTLILIILMQLFLGSPAEIINFVGERIAKFNDKEGTDAYNLVVAVCNTLQAINFSLNFVPYWIINAYVRRAARGLLRDNRISLQHSSTSRMSSKSNCTYVNHVPQAFASTPEDEKSPLEPNKLSMIVE